MNDPQISLISSPKLTPNIPLDLISSEILPRLPAKSLIRFKCVSKSWLSVISCPKFAKLHLQHSLSKPHNHGVLIQKDFSLFVVPNYSSFEYGSDRFNLDQVKVKLDHHGYEKRSLDVLGSCNGLVLLWRKSQNLRIWNPFTREFRGIPDPPVSQGGFMPSLWAFGYIPSLDDYKIVNLGRVKQSGYAIYSLRSNRWRAYAIGDLTHEYYELIQEYLPQPDCQPRVPGLVLHNAKAHWLWMTYTVPIGSANLRILVCDLVMETFSGMQVPDVFIGAGARYLCEHACIGVIEDDLCIVSHDESQCLQVWVLEKYGDEKSWKKFWRVSGMISPSCWNLKFCTFCCTEKGGKVLMNFYGDVWLLYWGEGDDVAQCVEFDGPSTTYMDQFIATLVSPFLLENA